MEPVIAKLRAVAQPLLSVRAAAWLAIIAVSSFSLGLALRDGIAPTLLDILLFLWVLGIGVAAADMHAAGHRAEMLRRKKLDALHGRRS